MSEQLYSFGDRGRHQGPRPHRDRPAARQAEISTLAFELLPPEFTLTELQRTVESISARHAQAEFRRLVKPDGTRKFDAVSPTPGRSPGGLMFDLPFDFFSLAVAIVALIFARKAFDQVAVLRARLDLLETLASPAAATPAAPPPLPAHEPPVAPSAADQTRIETTEAEAPPIQPATAPQPASEMPALPPPLPPAEPGFEERLGTRWVVWVGGLTLALGGFFMVRYSIEAGLLGPGVRTMLGGAVRAGAAGCRRMDPAQGEHFGDRRAADRQHSGDPHRRRDRGGVRDGLRRLCAVRVSGARHRVRSARHGGAGHARRRAAARPGAGRPRHRRRLRHAGSGVVRQAGFLGALYLSRHRHRGGVRAGADQAVALARGHHPRVRAALDLPLPAMRAVDGRAARIPCDGRIHPRRAAGGVRIYVRAARRRGRGRTVLVRLRWRSISWAPP